MKFVTNDYVVNPTTHAKLGFQGSHGSMPPQWWKIHMRRLFFFFLTIYLSIFTGSIARSASLPVFNLLRRRFGGFSPRRGDTLQRWGWNLAQRTGTKVPLLHVKFHRHRCNDKGAGPQNGNFYSDLTKMWNINAPQGRILCAISTKCAEFVPHFRMR